jgi:DNA-binding response OmpR family regulator
MATDPEERVIWLVGPQAEVLRTGMPPSQQEVTRCFAILAELPSLDQVHPRECPDLLVLDIAAEPKSATRIPALRLTWLAQVLALVPDCETAERCLLAGAGDVVIVPWTPAEVRLRANRLLQIPAGPLRAGDLVLDLAAREVRTWQEQVCLTPLEYDLLTYLLRNADRVVTFGSAGAQ